MASTPRQDQQTKQAIALHRPSRGAPPFAYRQPEARGCVLPTNSIATAAGATYATPRAVRQPSRSWYGAAYAGVV